MEWIRKVLNKKAFCVVFQSFFVVSTLVITTLSLISFVYYVTSTEYKFEKGYIIKVNSNITNFENVVNLSQKVSFISQDLQITVTV